MSKRKESNYIYLQTYTEVNKELEVIVTKTFDCIKYEVAILYFMSYTDGRMDYSIYNVIIDLPWKYLNDMSPNVSESNRVKAGNI